MNEYTIEHVGITVAELEKTVETYTSLGFREVRAAVDKPDLGLRLAMVQLGELKLEIIQPYIQLDKYIQLDNLEDNLETDTWLETMLETPLHRIGAYHVAVSVDDTANAYKELRQRGVAFIEEFLKKGIYFAVYPDGTIIEIKQKKG